MEGLDVALIRLRRKLSGALGRRRATMQERAKVSI
jgi:hypothetical protein